ncbi:MAG: hypothetical protein WC943_07340 [Elusimicrobiota bacterium]|jgi:hypothetical protein
MDKTENFAIVFAAAWMFVVASVLTAPARAFGAEPAAGEDPSAVAARYDFFGKLGASGKAEAGSLAEAFRYSWQGAAWRGGSSLVPYVCSCPRIEIKPIVTMALRPTMGFSWREARRPFEFFAEAGPSMRLASLGDVQVNASFGFRIAFGSGAFLSGTRPGRGALR